MQKALVNWIFFLILNGLQISIQPVEALLPMLAILLHPVRCLPKRCSLLGPHLPAGDVITNRMEFDYIEADGLQFAEVQAHASRDKRNGIVPQALDLMGVLNTIILESD
jgi:hypothetical protein